MPDDWMTTAQVANELGMTMGGARMTLRNEGVTERQAPRPGGGRPIAVFQRSGVEALAAKRKRIQRMKAQGYRWCSRCERWRPEERFWYRQWYCKDCSNEMHRERRQAKSRKPKPPAAQRRPRNWGSAKRGVETFPDSLDDLLAPGPPARAADSLKYACMDTGFRHRGIPPGQKKRQAFCSVCKAKRCVQHPELTPEQVMESHAHQ